MKDCAICWLARFFVGSGAWIDSLRETRELLYLMNAPFIFIDLLLTLGQHRRSLRSRNKHDHNIYKRHKFAYLVRTKIRFTRFARACFFVVPFTSILLSTTRNDLFYSCQVDETTCPFCHQTAVTNLIPRKWIHILQAKWLGAIEKWLEKREVKFLLTFSLSFLNYILQHWQAAWPN